MRVVQVNAVNGILSTGRTCQELSDYLESEGVECWTLYSFGKKTKHSVKISNPIESKIHAFLSRLTGLQGYYSFFSTWKTLQFIKKHKPDVVHLRNLHANYINFRVLLNYLAKNDIATVITLHDCWLYTGRCAYYSDVNCTKWINGCSNCKQLNTNNESWFFDFSRKMWRDKKRAFKRIERVAVVGVSKWVTEEAKNSFFRETNAKIVPIYNWIDKVTFSPKYSLDLIKKYCLDGLYIILGVSSKWSKLKGIDVFLELSKLLEKDEVIVLVGEMPSNIALPSNVISTGLTSSTEELAQFYSTADVFLQLSSQETFGKVVAESLACGTPVIGFDRTATSELINDNCGVLLSKEAGVSEIKCAVQQIRKNGKQFYKNNCIRFANEHFSKKTNCKKYLDLYYDLIDKNVAES